MGQRLKKGSPKLRRSRSPRQTVETLRLALRRERARHKEALEQQTATAEILRVISSSPTALRPVLDAILEKATHLCDAHLGVLNLFEGENCRTVAQRGGSPEFAEWVLGRGAFKPAAAMARVLADRRPFHVPDARQGPGYRARNANAMKFVDLGGVRTYLAVPLLKEGAVIGSINIFRPEVRPFTDKQIALVSTFANQAVIAIENTRQFNETKEALERQTATAEILRVISSTPTDVQPVFDAIVKSCFGLFRVGRVSLWIVDHGRVELRAREAAPGERAGSYRHTPLNRESGVGRCILDGRLLHVPDMLEVLDELPLARQLTLSVDYRSAVFTPLMRGDTALGAISLLRRAPGPFSDKEIALLQTFADQAVIAIENVRLFNELKSSNSSLREALEQQTATSDILKVISSSPTDVQPVFDTIVRNALRLSDAVVAWLFRYDGTMIDLAADSGVTEQLRTMYRTAFPQPPSKDNPVAEAILARRVVHVPDIFASDYSSGPKDRARVIGYRSILAVPMMRENAPIGAIVLAAPGTFSDRHVALLQMFADQAVIAIENVRLFNETKEALERQTATAEILAVISRSQTDVQPVFDTIATSALRLCDAAFSVVTRFDGKHLHLAAFSNVLPDFEDAIRGAWPQQPGPTGAGSRAIEARAMVQIPDILQDARYGLRGVAEKARFRSVLAVPMLRDGVPVGAIIISRTQPGPFPADQVALLKTFADQAVIAIENVRLFNELKSSNSSLREALEQQTATSEILKVISSTQIDVQPIFDTIIRNAVRLGSADLGTFIQLENGELQVRASYNIRPEADVLFRSGFPQPLTRDSSYGRAISDGAVANIDYEADPPSALALKRARILGIRSALAVPLMRKGESLGAIAIGRQEPGGFPEAFVSLLKTFADQAVIAIENARLFREIQEKSSQLEVANRQLEVANKHKSDFLANMSHELRTPLNAIIGFSEVMIEQMFGELNEKQLDYQKDIHASGKHLLSLINDILDLSKIEAGRMELELSQFHLPTAVSNAVTLIRERAQRHGIALGVEVDPRLGEFQADERKVKQILLNLLSNAVKFTPDGGRVDVSAKLDTDKVEIAVKDTGVGIAPADQASLFEEFKQFGNDRSRKAEGTGLGLALTRRLVELHGGQILVESAVGQGSTFRVMLPVRH